MDAATLDTIYKQGCLVSHAHGLQAVFDAGVGSTVVVAEPEPAPVVKAAPTPKAKPTKAKASRKKK